MKTLILWTALIVSMNPAFAEDQKIYPVEIFEMVLGEESKFQLTDDENYISIEVHGQADLPKGIEEKSGKVSSVQIHDKEFVEANCQISYCSGYFFSRGNELWIKIPVNGDKYIDKLVALEGPEGVLALESNVSIDADWVVQTANWLEKALGGRSGQWMSLDLSF